jgi:hypothetical protein
MVSDMEQLVRDQQVEMAKEKAVADNLYKRIQESRRY